MVDVLDPSGNFQQCPVGHRGGALPGRGNLVITVIRLCHERFGEISRSARRRPNQLASRDLKEETGLVDRVGEKSARLRSKTGDLILSPVKLS